MRNVFLRVVAGVISGLILLFITREFFTEKEEGAGSSLPDKAATEASKPDSAGAGSRPINVQSGKESIESVRHALASSNSPDALAENMQVGSPSEQQTLVRTSEQAAFQPPHKPSVEEAFRTDISLARAKGDSLSKDTLMRAKVRQVQQRSEDLFRDLEEELGDSSNILREEL